jgi:hypothetical protein
MTSPPNSDHDWKIHSLNIHGIFFERWCQDTLEKLAPWKVKSTNYPVEFGGKESALDLWVQLVRNHQVLNLPIECKKNNPDFIDWIFFPKKGNPTIKQIVVSVVDNSEVKTPADPRQYNLSLVKVPFLAPWVDEARETRGSYLSVKGGDKTKTSNKAIADAAYQVALATHAICAEEYLLIQRRFSSNPASLTPRRVETFIPTIITNAKLFVCEFDPKDVSPETGEIEFNNVSLIEKDSVIYEYPLPRHLQTGATDPVWLRDYGSIEDVVRKHILIIHSGALPIVMRNLERDIQLPN